MDIIECRETFVVVGAGKSWDMKDDGSAISSRYRYATVQSHCYPVQFFLEFRTTSEVPLVGNMTASTTEASSFPIPSSLQDLEREPYNLLPYPHDFDDDDEAARADSFGRLVELIDQGNQLLLSEGILLFQTYEGQVPWLQTDRVQALYTLVRYES